MRYPDELEIGFNVALNSTKLLVELDASVKEIRSRFSFGLASGKAVTTPLDHLLKQHDSSLMRDNCAFGTADRTELFQRQSHCYEMRVLGKNKYMQAVYQTVDNSDDRRFNVIGLKPG
jgi:hypothetical protein